MDPELAELHRGAREERKRMADTAPPAPPRDDETPTCDFNGCENDAVARRPGLNGTYLEVCHDHKARNGRGDPEGNAPL